MKRRFLIITAVTALFFCVGFPVQAKEELVAVILPKGLPRHQTIHLAFVESLTNNYQHGGSLQFLVQSPNPDALSLRNSVRKAEALGADLIIAYGAGAVLAAKAELLKLPVVFADVYDPSGQGLVFEPDGSGRNMTGIAGNAPIQTLLKIFLKMVPVNRLGVVFSGNDPDSLHQKERLVEVATNRGMTVSSYNIPEDKIEPGALANFVASVDAIYVADCMEVHQTLKKIFAIAHSHAVPILSQSSGMADLGALLSLEVSLDEQGHQAAFLAGQILGGQNVASLHWLAPRKISLVVNLKTAQDLELKVPFEVLSVTSRVVR